MSMAQDIVDGELCPLCTGTHRTCDCSPEAIKAAGGHIFVAERANARRGNQESWFAELFRKGAKIEQKNDGHHWVLTVGGKRWDFWPSRQKFRGPGSPHILRGFDRMISEMRRAVP